ncbi:hypothetical protein J2T12_002939 [Paenibacillus anaericanus]|uniref:hypothetical protein n=1 Tax=Paenibacillus anaericanus TaxID=170367 RepID=UPI00278448E9|nr:hypothetical protein [Paenibacillus anaericanus]MDQ0089527.1 hypothetical protein [Paenibacillus anaericanus]
MDKQQQDIFKRDEASAKTQNMDYNMPPSFEGGDPGGGRSRNPLDRRMKIFGAICMFAIIVPLMISGGSAVVNDSVSAQNALANKVSTAVTAGVVLLSADKNIGAQDYTITHKSTADQTKIWVWDYAAEDGDYVQVLVNGVPFSDSFMIKHKPRTFMVPAVGDIQIKGIRDGGGGITYAIRYEVNGTSYFNGTPEGEFNTYTLTR